MLFAKDRIGLELLRRNVDRNAFEVVRADVAPAEVVEIDFGSRR